ncbi:MAG: PRC-barrel domain-containing protein, partial [Gemmiger sp.]
MTLRELSEKDVIRVKTGENLGRIDDISFDETSAQISSVILRGRGHAFGLLGYDEDLIIPWQALQTIGTDVIMADADPLPAAPPRRHRFGF